MQMEHEKCLEIMFLCYAQVGPTLLTMEHDDNSSRSNWLIADCLKLIDLQTKVNSLPMENLKDGRSENKYQRRGVRVLNG